MVRSKDPEPLGSPTSAGVATSYGYDDLGLLLSESRPGYAASYTYDANGNRLTRTVNGVTEVYAYGPADRLLSVTGGANPRTFGYDAAGRTTSVVSGAGTTTLVYDFESRLTSVSGPGISASYVYNGLDTRVSKLENGVSNTFVRDGDYVTDPVLRDGAAAYTPGISERRGTVSTYLHGGLKNSVTQGAQNGTLSATRTYDAFGNVTASTGAWRGPFGYAGAFGYQEDQTGLRLLGHRYYDSSTGRFLTRDPIKDGRNWYGYGAGEITPVREADPTGLAVPLLIFVGKAIIAGGAAYLGGREAIESGEDLHKIRVELRTQRAIDDMVKGRTDPRPDAGWKDRGEGAVDAGGTALENAFESRYGPPGGARGIPRPDSGRYDVSPTVEKIEKILWGIFK